ncbi:hypothetical protein [Stenotrophomonas sp. NA06056]|uniref:hypothetical protein n=1 Tax=Stenotrophomonas sp. NA06056 TaxID=2742129 RepID=UPI001588739A|nr:hypothetical protein [Stenotrophomonas sp. NA06056]QKW57020.1 hypothetical protein HUT07_10520 [Stenotrophomonas sp. NA06056]
MADWGAVCIAAVGAYAVFKVSKTANTTAAKALEVAETLKTREQGIDARKAFLLAQKLYPELTRAGYFVFGLVTGMKAPAVDHGEGDEESDFFGEVERQTELTSCTKHLDDLHVLPSGAFKAINKALESTAPFAEATAHYLSIDSQFSEEKAFNAFLAAADELSQACLHAADELDAVMKSVES